MMKSSIITLAGIVLAVGFFVALLHSLPTVQPNVAGTGANAQAFGAFNTTGGGTYNLQATITSNQTTINLSSFAEPGSNIPYTMSYLNSSIEYGTIAPQTSQSEFISFTGITQNSDGSATLTGVQRGLERSYPYQASSTLAQPHAGQTRFILSNPPQVYNSYAALSNNNTFAGVNTFGSTTPPQYDADPVWANFSTQVFADVAYVNSVVAAGAANASETVKGIVQLATAAQVALGTSLGSTGARLGIPNSLATSTPTTACTSGCVPVAVNGKLSQLFFDLTQQFIFSGKLLSTASTSFTATTTFNGSNVLSNAVIFNGVPYAFPSSQGVANSFLGNNGSGVLAWSVPPQARYSIVNTTGVTATGASNPNLATSSVLNIPAGTLTGSSTITVAANITCTTSSSDCVFYLRDSGGTTFITCDFGSNSVSGTAGFLNITIANQSSLSSQLAMEQGVLFIGTTQRICNTGTTGSSSFNTANALNLVFVVSSASGQTSTVSNYSMVVNP